MRYCFFMKRMQPDIVGKHVKHIIYSTFGCDVVLQANEERARYYKCKKKPASASDGEDTIHINI